jgi:hypothetical protein
VGGRKGKGETVPGPHIGNRNKDSKWWFISVVLYFSELVNTCDPVKQPLIIKDNGSGLVKWTLKHIDLPKTQGQ